MNKEDEEWMNAPMGTPKQQPPAGESTKEKIEVRIFECQNWVNAKDWNDLRARLDTAEALNKDLLTALIKYGNHEPGCMRGDACNCGFKAAIAKAHKE